MSNTVATVPESPSSTALNRFEEIPEEATIFSPAPLPSAVLALPGNANAIEIGKASRVIPDRNALLVGRQVSSCDIRIGHKSLSRRHALLYYHSARLWVLDLKTKAGTFVNEKKIISGTPVELNDGDTIQFGKAKPIFTVRWDKNSALNEVDDQDSGKANAANSSIQEGASKSDEQGGQDPHNNRSSRNTDADNNVSSKGKAITKNGNESGEPPSLEGLTGRERRRAEIAAMMASLDETPTYEKYVPTATSNAGTQQPQQESHRTPSDDNCFGEEQASLERKKTRVLEKHRIPITDCTDMAVLDTSHVSTSAMDPTGARFAIGSMDSSLKLYDFAGYNIIDPVPFQHFIVEDGYPVRSMAYSSDGSSILIGTGSAQPRVFSRDGSELVKFVRGDIYVRDPSKTIGHTAPVTSVGWHPLEASTVFSTSRDGSLRCWNIDKGKLSFGMLNCSDVIGIKHLRTGRMTIPTCLAISPNTLAVGTECGSLQIFKYPFVSKLRPQQSVQVSLPNTEKKTKKDADPIVSLVYSLDATKIAVRTKKEVTLWNAASKLSTSTQPWMKYDNLPLHDDDTGADSSTPTMAFSPNGKILCVATNTKVDGSGKDYRSRLELFLLPKESKPKRDKKYTSPVFSMPISDGKDDAGFVMSLSWHPKLNQLLVTTQKGFQVFFSTEWSKNGILLTSGRRKKRKSVEESLQDLYAARAPPPGTAIRQEEIITPNSLPLFSGDKQRAKSKKQRAEEDHQDSVARHIPQQPSKGVFNTGVNMFTQMIMDDRSSHQKKIAGMDPREALAEYSEGKSFIGKAYEGNVERILTEKTMEQEQEEMNGKAQNKK
ncbi:unnamed protein product [Pseudo-nitzschia multistriata]|uniref:FHA domain-containing protein n=1 Tax=Pseudo-nitzschia multistriata TaxID=183589 RepID=A0A448Z991_9STRA|nr:unnamed protein product [Pseudo-nitzschia multistriata]